MICGILPCLLGFGSALREIEAIVVADLRGVVGHLYEKKTKAKWKCLGIYVLLENSESLALETISHLTSYQIDMIMPSVTSFMLFVTTITEINFWGYFWG